MGHWTIRGMLEKADYKTGHPRCFITELSSAKVTFWWTFIYMRYKYLHIIWKELSTYLFLQKSISPIQCPMLFPSHWPSNQTMAIAPRISKQSHICLLLLVLLLLLLLSAQDMVFLCNSSGYHGTGFLDQGGLKLTEICLLLPPECWSKRCMPPCPAFVFQSYVWVWVCAYEFRFLSSPARFCFCFFCVSIVVWQNFS